jgi:hypothetical protein
MEPKTSSLLAAPAEWPARLVVVVGRLDVTGGGAARAELRRAQSLLGRRLRQQALALVGNDDDVPACSSMSHSGTVAVACAGHGLAGLGIDVEGPRPRAGGRIAAWLGWTDRLPAIDHPGFDGAFTRRWTLWEAAVKCDDSSVLAAGIPGFTALGRYLGGPATDADRPNWSGDGYHAARWYLGNGQWVTVVGRGRTAPRRPDRPARHPPLPHASRDPAGYA